MCAIMYVQYDKKKTVCLLFGMIMSNKSQMSLIVIATELC